MDHNRFLFSFFFICFLSYVPNTYCAQLPKKNSAQSYSIVSISDVAIDPGTTEYCEPKFILKISDDSFLLVDGENSSDVRTFNIQQKELNDMMDASTQKGRCYVHIKRQEINFHFKINKDKLQDAIRSEPVVYNKNKKKPIKSLPLLDSEKSTVPEKELPKESLGIPPIHPNDFKWPHKSITQNSTLEDLSYEAQIRIREQQNKKSQEELKKVERQKQQEAEQMLVRMKEENDEKLKGLNRYYQEMYLQKMEDSVVLTSIRPKSRIIGKELRSINQKLEKIQPSLKISAEEYKKMSLQDHIAQLALWDIQQFNQYNKLLEENEQPRISYEQFHGKVCSLKVRHKTSDRRGPEFDRFLEMGNYVKEVLEEIEPIEKETEELKELIKNYSQDYAKARIMANGGAIVTDCILEEALYVTALELVSPIADKTMKKNIDVAKKENKQLDKILDQRVVYFNALSEEALLERRKIETNLAQQIKANKRLSDKLSKKKKTTEERINDLQAQLKEQGTKYDK